MGQGFADAVGVAEPPMELDDSVKGVLEQVCYSLHANLVLEIFRAKTHLPLNRSTRRQERPLLGPLSTMMEPKFLGRWIGHIMKRRKFL